MKIFHKQLRIQQRAFRETCDFYQVLGGSSFWIRLLYTQGSFNYDIRQKT